MISLEKAKEYFSHHLLGELFLESGEALMDPALRMAENDVKSQLVCEASEDDPCYAAAVCEQAVFLLAHKDQLTENKVLLSETIEGLGSRSYAGSGKTAPVLLSPRAELYIQNINRLNTIYLERG